jgi:hypothetical protein
LTPRSKITGYLEIGINPETFEIVINLDEDRNGIGHVTFSPDQARNLASILIRKADEVDKDWQAAVASLRRAGRGKKRKPHK